MSKGRKRDYSLPFGVKSPVEQSERAKKGLPPENIPKKVERFFFDEAGFYDFPRQDEGLAKVTVAVKLLEKLHPGRNIKYSHSAGGDYYEFSLEGRYHYVVSGTFIASSNPRVIAQFLERGLNLKYTPKGDNPFRQEWTVDFSPVDEAVKDNRSEAEKFADDWIKDNARTGET